MPRSKKYEDSTWISVRIESDLKDLVQKKAEEKGDTITELVNSFLKTYVNVNSPIDQLEGEIRDQRRRVEREKTKLDVLERELESAKEEERIYFEPKERRYLQGPFYDLSDEKQRERIRGMADRKGVNPEELVEKAEKQIEGFHGISGETALDMGEESE